MPSNNIKRIVLTGGPCAGKTTALAAVVQHFSEKGYKVFTLPEVPTMVTQAGWNYMTTNHEFLLEGERLILNLQLQLEDRFQKLAKTYEEPCLIVCDRGTMDISAYLDPTLWQQITGEINVTDETLRQRYDAVVHLVTAAADGTEEFYNTFTNAQRYENADEEGRRIARMLDDKVANAWQAHPHVIRIENEKDFDHKTQKVIEAIEDIISTE